MAIKFIWERVKDYSLPENLEKWCLVARKEIGYTSRAHSLYVLIRRKLENIEDLQGFSLSEKVRLLFLFSVRVIKDFMKELQDAKFLVKLNSSNKVTFFLSPDGTAYQSNHSKNLKYFKGKKDDDFAFNYELDAGFHQKCLRAVFIFEKRDQRIPTDVFIRLYDMILQSLKRENPQKAHKKSMKLLTLLKMMKTALIDLLGADEMGYAQKMLDEEAWKLEGGEDEVSLKTIQKKTGLSDASGHEPMGRSQRMASKQASGSFGGLKNQFPMLIAV
ncbi:hypothetical protein L3Y34_001486 [Caenorhabditis briggsae]|uniref:SPK domain-containing protein n=1 Tax=Caenorhabditis briggsae TaxID=6238 RepID=A0AAE9DCE2_CAEBR|nr:hypothetical protein L3Y34_001486 [Caenorhabditis briggsae]